MRVFLILTLLGPFAVAQDPVPISKLPFSAARKAGHTLYVSGNIPRTPEGEDVRESVAAETHQVMKNLERALRTHGYTWDDVVKVSVYLKDIEDYHEMNKAYASYFTDRFPARECIGGAQIVFDFRVEISCIAHKEP